MKKHLIIVSVFITLLAFASCKEKFEIEKQDFPIITTNEVEIISDTGIVVTATIDQQGNNQIIEYGFLWDQSEYFLLSSSGISHISTKAIVEGNNFEANINYGLKNEQTYFIRAYCKTENDTIYGNIVNFKSKGSKPPVIYSFSPTEGTDGTIITVEGDNFTSNKNNLSLLFGDTKVYVDSSNQKKIFFTVPSTPETGDYSISINILGKEVIAPKTFKVLGTLITEIIPNPVYPGNEIRIKGEYFSNEIYENNLIIDDTEIEITSCTEEEITVFIPYNMEPKDSEVTLTVGNKIATAQLTILSAWTQKADFGGVNRSRAVGFSIAGKGYIGTGIGNEKKRDFWEYDPETDTWNQKADFGGNARYEAVGFAINEKGYIGTGRGDNYENDFWEYNPITNVWTQKANFGGFARSFAFGFSIGNKGYIGGGTNVKTTDLWEYSPETDTWTQKNNFGGGPHGISFSIGNKAYVGTGYGNQTNVFREYNPDTDTWIQKTNYGGSDAYANATGFSIGEKGYIISSNNTEFWEYNPETDTWIQKENFRGIARKFAVGFSIGNKGYIGTGEGGYNYLNDFWEYDPNQTH